MNFEDSIRKSIEISLELVASSFVLVYFYFHPSLLVLYNFIEYNRSFSCRVLMFEQRSSMEKELLKVGSVFMIYACVLLLGNRKIVEIYWRELILSHFYRVFLFVCCKDVRLKFVVAWWIVNFYWHVEMLEMHVLYQLLRIISRYLCLYQQ